MSSVLSSEQFDYHAIQTLHNGDVAGNRLGVATVLLQNIKFQLWAQHSGMYHIQVSQSFTNDCGGLQ